MPKYKVGDTLKSGSDSFKVEAIEEDLETGKPIYVDAQERCFAESECKRTRKAS